MHCVRGMIPINSKVTGESQGEAPSVVKPPEKRSAPVYAGCSQHPNTHRSATHVGSHMHPPQGIAGSLPVQAALSLCPSAALSGVLLAVNRGDPRSGERDAQGTWGVFASEASILDDSAYGPVEPVGCHSGDNADGGGHPADAASPSGRGPVCHWG